MNVISKVNFALTSSNKNQLRKLYNHLNEILITAPNTLDDSVRKNHHVGYCPQRSFQLKQLTD